MDLGGHDGQNGSSNEQDELLGIDAGAYPNRLLTGQSDDGAPAPSHAGAPS
jgi:hypothetical protein